MNKKEQIIEFGKKQGKTQAQIDSAVAKYEASSAPKPKPGIGADISTAFKGGLDYAKQGYEEGLAAKNPLTKTEAGLKIGAGALGAAFSPLAPVTKYIGQGINAVADKVSDIPAVQDFAMSGAGKTTARVAEDVQNTSAFLGLKGAKPVGGAIKTAAQGGTNAVAGMGSKIGAAGKQIGGALKDIKPEAGSFITHQVSQALHLTPGDMSNFFGKIDQDVGQFVADNNLIGETAEATLENLRTFKNANYDAVRTEIANVPKAYKISQVPRYYDSLKQVYEQVDGVKGLEKTAVEVENMLKKEVVTLEDVQRVKELMDDHFQLYKVTGDVKDATSKKGVATMRQELKEFVENEVSANNPQADIRGMNKNVQASRALLDAAELRTPRGLKSYQPGMGDWAMFGFGSVMGGGFNPLTGIAALFFKKALETPSVRLRLAKLVDEMSDARKARAKAELESGVIPNEFRSAVKIKHNGQVLKPD